MKYFIVVCIVLINYSFSIAQEIIIKAANSNGKAALFSLSGEKSSFIDSISLTNNQYQFNLADNHPGFYRFIFSNNKWIDFVFDNENVELKTDVNNILDSLVIVESVSNKLYYEFVKCNKEYKTKSELLTLIINEYPREEDYKKLTRQTLAQAQLDYLNFVNTKAQLNRNSFIARYIKTAQYALIKPDIHKHEYLKYFKTYALYHVDFSDADLIYSDAFTNKAIEYLTYYRNPQLPMGLLEKEFQTAVDSILNKAKANEIVYKHIVEYLLDGFKKFGFDNVINYIIDNYVIADEICLDEKLETALERRIQQNKLFNPGFIVPDIEMNDSAGSIVKLSNINTEKTLIIFYASWCPHCKDMLPQIYELYKNQKDKKFEVLAVSIDTSKIEWLNFIRTNKLDWLNVSDLKGWDGKAATDYFLYATPTILLVDNDGVFIQTIINTEELKNYIN